ncbi:MAG: glycosyltransferase [Planctomycetota bacterium]|nr:MAG: glycosyltransferase [Planctomycetota bacterium]
MHATPATRLTTVFSKRPSEGRVKTRLSPPLTAAQAAALARAMLDDVVGNHLASGAFRLAIAAAPADAVDWFRARYPGVETVEPQVGEGLGARLAAWFDRYCASGTSVVVIGSDCPLLGSATIVAAHEALERGADAVFAPDAGGGYCLVGLTRSVPRLFTDVPMSEGDMFARTLDVARAEGLAVECLPEHYDVDVESDLERLKRDLMQRSQASGAEAAGGFPAHTHRFLLELQSTSR